MKSSVRTSPANASQRITLFVSILVFVWYGFYLIQPPDPESSEADPVTFSAERAFEHVNKLTGFNRPMGSPGNEEARKYLFRQLSDLNLQPAYQEGIALHNSRGIAGRVTNITAVLEGADPEKTILLMAHYDSVPNAPGAGDNASGIAAILETLRALQSLENPLKNNIRVLFTDGEERGLLGAELFFSEHPATKDIDLVLNFEARGSSGASIMFETGNHNSELLPHYARATRYPVANSLTYTVYKLLPNDTDFSVTKRAGLQGLNFAFADDYLNYHTLQDNAENLSPASLQHHGSNMLDNVMYFGSFSFNLESDSDFVYFNNPAGGLSYYPAEWSLPLAIITFLLFLFWLIYLFRTRQVTIGTYLSSILLFAVIIAGGGLITYFGWQLVKLIHPDYRWLIHGETYNRHWYLWGFSLLNIGLTAMIFSVIKNRLTVRQLLTGVYTVWVVLGCVVAWFLPDAAYLATWPALFGLLGWIAIGPSVVALPSWRNTGVLILSLFPALFLIPPYIYLIQVLLTTELLAAGMPVLLLITGLCWPLLYRIIEHREGVFNSAVLSIGLLCFAGAYFTSGYDAGHKKQNSINYFYNMDTEEAYWVSHDDATDSWTNQFLGDKPTKGQPHNIDILHDPDYLFNPASIAPVKPPRYEVLSDSTGESLRYISVNMYAVNEGIGVRIGWSNNSGLTKMSLMGKVVFNRSLQTASQDLNQLFYFQDLTQPINIEIIHDPEAEDQSLTFSFINNSLPPELLDDYQERSDHLMPKPFILSDATVWETKISFAELVDDE